MKSYCCDFLAFQQAGLSEIYETISSWHLFMVCEAPNFAAFSTLPQVFSFRSCRHNEINTWTRIVTEEAHISYAINFYENVYAKNADEFFKRCIFVCDAHDTPVGSSFIWRAYGKINTVGWTRVLPEYEGKGLGRALLSEVLRTADFPVYLHTQPSSICAIKLYSDLGFALITNEKIGYRKNNLSDSLQYMKKVVPKSDFDNLRFVKTDDTLHEAALTNNQSEF